jgi:hypothetical protein
VQLGRIGQAARLAKPGKGLIALGLAFWALGERKRRAGLLGIAVTVPGPSGDEPARQ